tara:strand:- start:7 stop:219 length:213 start_codon:yes stop_codon:yes gene_type:complete
MNNEIKEIEAYIAQLEADNIKLSGSMDPEKVEIAQASGIMTPEQVEIATNNHIIKMMATEALRILKVGNN